MLMESQHRSQSKSMAVRMRQVATFMRTGQPGQPGLGKPSGLLAQRSGRTRKSIRRIGIFQYESQHVQFPSYASISFRMKGKTTRTCPPALLQVLSTSSDWGQCILAQLCMLLPQLRNGHQSYWRKSIKNILNKYQSNFQHCYVFVQQVSKAW